MKVLIAITTITVMTLLSGCQVPGKLVSKKDCPVCPGCKAVTTTGVIRGTTVTTVFCPKCQKEFKDHRVLDYVEPTAGNSGIFHCDKCGKNYELCPNCAGI